MRQSSSITLSARCAQEMQALGHALGQSLPAEGRGAVVIGFEGELGAGKTTLVQGVLRALGARGPIRSPTYTLIEPYELGERRLYHLDLYRLAEPGEAEALGLRDLLEPSSVLLIEWPSRGAGWLPPADLAIDIEYAETTARRGSSASGTDAGDDAGAGRTLTLKAGSSAGAQLIERLLAATSQ